jgi:hypothetical protein
MSKLTVRSLNSVCHPRVGGYPDREDSIPYISRKWIPAYAGITEIFANSSKLCYLLRKSPGRAF